MDFPLGYKSASAVIRLGRAAFFGSSTTDLPRRRSEALRRDDLIPQFGYVGREYAAARVLLLGINPGNGPIDAASPSSEDQRMMPLLAAFAAEPSVANFMRAQEAQKIASQTWPVWRRHCAPIFGAGGLSFEQIAYSNCLPWRTGSESNFDDEVASRSACLYALPLIEELAPTVVIALGKRVASILRLGGRPVEPLIVWNRSQAATPPVLQERQAAAERIFRLVGKGEKSERSSTQGLTATAYPVTGRGAYDLEDRVILLVDGNPKTPGSASYLRFAVYRDGMTVRQYIDDSRVAPKGRADLKWDIDHRFIQVVPPSEYEAALRVRRGRR